MNYETAAGIAEGFTNATAENATAENVTVPAIIPIILLCMIIFGICQYFLSGTENKWSGMIIPVVSFFASIATAVFLVKTNSLLLLFLAFLLLNFPTAIFLIIYAIGRDKIRKRLNESHEIEKMNIQDIG